jgi:DNA-binding CsgD family transcriptional regulator
MMTSPSLTRTSERIINFLEGYSKTTSRSAVEDFLPRLHTLQNIFPQWVLLTCPIKHTNTRFITENSNSILNIKPDFFKKIYAPEFLYAQVHEDDQLHVNLCFQYVSEFFKNRLPEEYPKMRYALQYRYRRQDGSYITLHDEKCALSLPDGTVLYYTIMKDITQETIFTGVKVDMYKQNALLEKIDTYRPNQAGNSLSKRETELVSLLKKGLTTKETAYHLNISQHTVRNMKQNMFEKYKVNNVIELLNKTLHYS